MRIKRMSIGAVFCSAFVILTTGAISAVDGQVKDHKTPIKDITFVAFDTETTGLSPTNDRIVEVGVIKFRNGEVIEEKSWLINPGRPIPKRVQKVHGITDEMVQGKPDFKTFYPEFEAFVDGCVLIAHNARFDVSMMREEIKRNELETPSNVVFDTLKLFRKWYPESKSHKLSILAEHLGVNAGGFHRAEVDSLYCVLILFNGLEDRPKVDTLRELLVDAGGVMVF